MSSIKISNYSVCYKRTVTFQCTYKQSAVHAMTQIMHNNNNLNRPDKGSASPYAPENTVCGQGGCEVRKVRNQVSALCVESVAASGPS